MTETADKETDATASNHSAYFVPGLHRGLRILEILAASEQPLTLSEIAGKIDVSRSSAFRLVYTLKQMKFLKEADRHNTYTLGARVLNLGFAYLNQQPLTTIARPHVEALRDSSGVSAHFSILEGREVLYLDTQQSRSAYVSNTATGARSPAYATGVGWCLLGSKNEEELRNLFGAESLPPRNEHTPRTIASLARRVEQARKDGYVISRGFFDPGGSSVIAPVRDNTGGIAAAVDISGPDTGFDLDRIETHYLPMVLETARAISAELGYRG